VTPMAARSRRATTWVRVLVPVAAAFLILGGLASLVTSGGRGQDESASDSSAGGGPEAADREDSATALAPPVAFDQPGALADAAEAAPSTRPAADPPCEPVARAAGATGDLVDAPAGTWAGRPATLLVFTRPDGRTAVVTDESCRVLSLTLLP
jgi:hypothetical protein